jgi:antitoxin ParD1/3/4
MWRIIAVHIVSVNVACLGISLFSKRGRRLMSGQNYQLLVVLDGCLNRMMAMPTTSIDLGEHFTGFIADLKSSGRYRNASEAVRAGLRLLEEQEAEYQTKLERLRQAIDEGDASGDSDLSHDEIIAQAKAGLDGE